MNGQPGHTTYDNPHGPYGPPPQTVARPKTPWEKEVADGQLWSYASYGSMFLGFPLFIIPMITKDNRFAMFHAKQAAVIYIEFLVLTMVVFLFSFITCGLGVFLVPLVFVAYIPTIHGFAITSKGQMEAPMLTFGLGEQLLGGMHATPKAEYGHAEYEDPRRGAEQRYQRPPASGAPHQTPEAASSHARPPQSSATVTTTPMTAPGRDAGPPTEILDPTDAPPSTSNSNYRPAHWSSDGES